MPISCHIRTWLPLALVLSLVACENDNAPGHAQMPPPAVGVQLVQSETVAITEQLPGRLEASRTAEVRARVSGIVEKRYFTEGSDIKRGQLLFQIDDAPYKAAVAEASAQKARAKAMLAEAKYQEERFQKLVADKAVSELELIKAEAQLEQAKAEYAAADAKLEVAEINLTYTKVTAPINGRIGHSFVTEGALVSQSSATAMAKIQQFDPMYINLQQNSQKLLQQYIASKQGHLQLKDKEQGVEVELLFSNGSPYNEKGKLLFSDINVDEGTGQLLMRAEISNPEGLLLPGMYVQVKFQQATWPNAFLVPQSSVMRDDKGDSVMIVDKENTLTVRPVSVAGSVNGQWLITQGLENGEQLMIDGFQKARPGGPVSPVVIGEQGKEKPESPEGSQQVAEQLTVGKTAQL